MIYFLDWFLKIEDSARMAKKRKPANEKKVPMTISISPREKAQLDKYVYKKDTFASRVCTDALRKVGILSHAV